MERLLAPAALWSLSLADLLFTLYLLDFGYTEANPLAAWLLGQSLAATVLWKVGGVSILCGILYLSWSYRPVRIATRFVVALYVLLVVYEIALFARR